MSDTSEAGDVVLRLSEDAVSCELAALRWALHDLMRSGARTVVVDLSEVEHLSSSAVATLLGAHRRCRARGGAVILRGANRRTLDLLYRTGLWRVLPLEDGRPGDSSRPSVSELAL
ncbi:MAG: STAS domain-containing protein [Actinomycetes bacterium]